MKLTCVVLLLVISLGFAGCLIAVESATSVPPLTMGDELCFSTALVSIPPVVSLLRKILTQEYSLKVATHKCKIRVTN